MAMTATKTKTKKRAAKASKVDAKVTKSPAKPAKTSAPTSKGRTTSGPVTLLVGTQKGAFVIKSDKDRAKWTVTGPTMLGNIVNHMVASRTDPRTILMGVRTGHLGPTVFRTQDGGKTWKEASEPPAFPKATSPDEKPKTVAGVFWLTEGHPSEPGVWYAGTAVGGPPGSPGAFGLFRSEDGGDTWKGVKGFNDYHIFREHPDFFGTTPGGALTHSILIDPRNKKHMIVGLSGGGVFLTRDQGKSWEPLNKGVAADFMPMPDPEFGHDPHCLMYAESNPDVIYQQNHCGIYRIVRPSDRWERIGNNMPKEIGDIGFPVRVHPRDENTAWVVPMDGTEVWPRTSVNGKPAVYVTRDGGKSWKRQDKGLPKSAFLTTYRQAFANDAHNPVGLYFGTSSGEIYASHDEGKTWTAIASHLPSILAVTVA